MIAVDVPNRPILQVGVPRRLFEKRYETAVSLYANYSTDDGERSRRELDNAADRYRRYRGHRIYSS